MANVPSISTCALKECSGSPRQLFFCCEAQCNTRPPGQLQNKYPVCVSTSRPSFTIPLHSMHDYLWRPEPASARPNMQMVSWRAIPPHRPLFPCSAVFNCWENHNHVCDPLLPPLPPTSPPHRSVAHRLPSHRPP